MRKIFIFMIAFLQYQSFAGTNRVGNGGDVFVCHETKNLVPAKSPFKKSKKPDQVARVVKTVELLDFMESELSLVEYSGDHHSILSQVIKNLKTIAPQLANQYEKRIGKIVDEIYYQEYSLKDIEDSSEIIERKDCTLVQAAVRKNEVSYGEKRFVIQKSLWDKMDSRHKAGLILHEVIYEHFFKLGEFNSVKARKVNALLFSSSLSKMTTHQFYANLQKMDLPIYQR
jgi:hypothetical protein